MRSEYLKIEKNRFCSLVAGCIPPNMAYTLAHVSVNQRVELLTRWFLMLNHHNCIEAIDAATGQNVLDWQNLDATTARFVAAAICPYVADTYRNCAALIDPDVSNN